MTGIKVSLLLPLQHRQAMLASCQEHTLLRAYALQRSAPTADHVSPLVIE
jgi:hypothetical protein